MNVVGSNNLGTISQYAQAVMKNPDAKRALCFGDSWFQYPPNPTDINKQLARMLRGTLFMNEGVAGRDSAQWKVGLPRIQREIGAFQFDAILISNGGNDVVGAELKEFVKTAAQPQSLGATNWGPLPLEVFDHIRLETFEHALTYVTKDLKELVQYRDMSSPKSVIYVHTYDYVYPTGIPFKLLGIKAGPWIKPSLDAVGLDDPDAQRVVSSWLLDQFARVLSEFASQNAKMRVVDSRGTLTSVRQWENEIHPVASGFKAIAKQCWMPALDGVLE